MVEKMPLHRLTLGAFFLATLLATASFKRRKPNWVNIHPFELQINGQNFSRDKLNALSLDAEKGRVPSPSFLGILNGKHQENEKVPINADYHPFLSLMIKSRHLREHGFQNITISINSNDSGGLSEMKKKSKPSNNGNSDCTRKSMCSQSYSNGKCVHGVLNGSKKANPLRSCDMDEGENSNSVAAQTFLLFFGILLVVLLSLLIYFFKRYIVVLGKLTKGKPCVSKAPNYGFDVKENERLMNQLNTRFCLEEEKSAECRCTALMHETPNRFVLKQAKGKKCQCGCPQPPREKEVYPEILSLHPDSKDNLIPPFYNQIRESIRKTLKGHHLKPEKAHMRQKLIAAVCSSLSISSKHKGSNTGKEAVYLIPSSTQEGAFECTSVSPKGSPSASSPNELAQLNVEKVSEKIFEKQASFFTLNSDLNSQAREKTLSKVSKDNESTFSPYAVNMQIVKARSSFKESHHSRSYYEPGQPSKSSAVVAEMGKEEIEPYL